jgi:hypothetical protein
MSKNKRKTSKRKKLNVVRRARAWRNMTSEQRTLEKNKQTAGTERVRFFEENGDLAQWRGRSTVYTDKKKKGNKLACRNLQHDV